ncbi:MAG: peptidoglycan DD-metalloendopeptidase family protein, partial [Burkholderiaceae bacterium]|nr:peptidoglycan DD-metalloendopeptidase family protein [Burkholderiaceae bacterium]
KPDMQSNTGKADATQNTHESTHVVVAGETLFRIAHNNGLKYQDVANWNRLPGGYSIKVGQILRLTPPNDSPAVIPVEPAPKSKPVPAAAAVAAPIIAENSASADAKDYPKALKMPYSATAAKTLAAQSDGPGHAVIIVRKPASKTTTVASAPAAAVEVPATPEAGQDASAPANANGWIWPAQGKVVQGFSEANKGIDIAGKLGQPVVAVANGSVVYSGSGLRGYGKLIIIKHDKTFLTAYAHNSQIFVKEGQAVKKGQKIAEMGSTDSDQVKLHFEVRRFGKPVDPAQYLDKQS